jgi:hypothetical protein
MKPITKQLAIAAFILTSVTVLSFGIRRVRLSNHWANTIENSIVAGTGESAPARLSNPENQSQPEQSLGANAEPDNYPDDSGTDDTEPDPQYANASDSDKEAPSDDYSMTQSFKGGYAKSEGKNGLQKISLGEYDNIYITEKGEAWYVSEQPDGSTTKMQVQVVDITGEITFVGGGYYGKSGGSQDPQRIPMGDYESIYIPGEGELWYKADGSLLEADIISEVTIVSEEEINEYSDNGEERATKD